MDPTSQPLCLLRIYLAKRATVRSSGWLGRLLGRPLAHHLVREALRGGLVHASVTLGHMGYAPGGSAIAESLPEHMPVALPTCVEVVGTAYAIERFVADQRHHLESAVLLRLDGAAHLLSTRSPEPQAWPETAS